MMNVGTIMIGSNGMRYRVGEKVGEGITSEVFEGVHEVTGMPVALKVLRAGVGPLVADEFWLEGEVLRELGRAELRRGDGVRGVPRVFDVQREGEVRFMVMELVEGQSLDEVLQAQSYLAEGDALVVAEQLLRVLDLLHQQGRSVSPHFPLRRIWLQRGADGRLTGVKVMDWRQVGEKAVEDDLACVAAHLYRMLTGKGADRAGETERALERRAGRRWQALSLGTRQVLSRALRADLARRFSSAAAFRAAVQAQQALWRQDPFDLMLMVKRWLHNPILDVDQVARITAQLDMAERLGAPAKHVRVYWQHLEQHIGQISLNWKTGEQYYRAEQYREALSRWREEAQIKGRVRLWRWVMLAEMGVALGRASFASVRKQMEDAVQALDQGAVTQAFERLEALQIAGLRSESFDILRKEALARHKIEQGQQAEVREEPSDWENAALAYRDAAAALQEIAYVSLIYDNQPEWPNLLERSAALEEQAAQQRHTEQAERELQALLQQDFEEGRRVLHAQLRRQPTCRWLVRLCLAEGTRHLATRQYGQAEALLAIGVLFGQVVEYEGQLRQSWLEAIAKRRLARQLEPVKVEYEEEVAALREVYTQEMAGLKEQYTQDMASLERAYQKAFREQVDKYNNELAKTESQYRQDLQALQAAQEKQKQKIKAEKERLTQEVFRLQHKHQHDLENEQKLHEQKLAEIRVKYDAEIKNERAKPQKALTLVWEDKKEEFIKDLKKLFYEKRWGDFLQLAASAPQLLRTEPALRFSSSSVHRDFKAAIERRQVLIADKLLQVLELLESGSSTIARYKRQYQDMVRKVERESPESVDRLTVQGLIEYQLASKPIAAYDQIVEAIEKLLPLTGSDFVELKGWLEEKREEAEGKWLEEVPQESNSSSSDDFSRSEAAPSETTEVLTTESSKGENVTRGGDESGTAASQTTEVVTTESSSKGENVTSGDDESGTAPSETTEVVTTKPPTPESEVTPNATPEELVKKGMDALRQLTPESLEEAKRCFKEAKELLGGAENRPLRRRIRAGQTFIQYLVEPKKAYHILTLIFPPELKEYTRIAFYNRKWLENHSLMQWIEEMNRCSEEANKAESSGKMVLAEEHRKKRNLLEKMINKVIDIWWDSIIKPVF